VSEPFKSLKPLAPKKILIIPLRYIGDTILTVPLIRNLRTAFPQAQIDVLASRTSAPLLETCPYLSSVLIEPKSSLERVKLLQRNSYDAVFLLRKSVSMAMLCLLAGIPVRVGYDKQRFPWSYKRWGWFLTHTARYPGLKTDTPQAVSHLELLKAVGLQPVDDHLELWSTPTDEQKVDELLLAAFSSAGELTSVQDDLNVRRLAVLHAASASHGKQIELEKFAASLKTLHADGYTIFTTGTQQDYAGYEELSRQTSVPICNLAGKTTLRETFALYRRIQLLLTVDSSPVHLGAAAGVPKIVGVFGPTNERQWGPHNTQTQFNPVFMNLPCRPCYAKVCEHNNCRTQLTGQQIANALHNVKP
jgi:ADP-heptose:LPS heptosyltransferase